MNVTTIFAIAGALLAAMAVPAYATKDMANEKSVVKAEHGERHHGRQYDGHGRRHNAMMGGHGMMVGYGRVMTFDTDGDGRVPTMDYGSNSN